MRETGLNEVFYQLTLLNMHQENTQISPQILEQMSDLMILLQQQKCAKERICIRSIIEGAFLTRLRNKTSRKNLRHYQNTFIMFFRIIPIQYVDEFTLKSVRDFVTARTGKVSKNTIRTDVTDLVAFNNWLIKEGYKTKLDQFSYNDTDAPPKHKCQSNTDVVTREQVLTFWNIVMKNRSFQSEYDMKLYQALFGMYIFQVPRLNEARRIYRNKIDLTCRTIGLHPDYNKGGRIDSLLIHKMYYPILIKFIECRDSRKINSPWLFYYGKPESPISESTIKKWINQINKTMLQKYGYTERITAHTFRHFFGHNATKDRVPAPTIQRALRHTCITTTHKSYTHFHDIDALEHLDEFNPFFPNSQLKYKKKFLDACSDSIASK